MLTQAQKKLINKCKGNLDSFNKLIEDIILEDTEILFCLYNDNTDEYTHWNLDGDTNLEIANANDLEIDDQTQMVDYGDDRSEDYVGDIFVEGELIEDYWPTRGELVKYLFYKISATLN